MRMATYDLDPDVTRWGLHLLDVCTLTNNGCCNAITRYDQDLSQVEYVNEGYCENAYVENDEAVARALQEEFTRIDSLEASGLSNVGEENIQSSVLAQDWLGPSKRHYSTGNDNDKKGTSNPGRNMEEADDCSKMENYVVAEIGNFHPCFSPGEKSSYVEDFSNTLDITDESVLDGEVGKRLNQMVPVPHVPKTNEKIPSADEEITDHQRLLERIKENLNHEQRAYKTLEVEIIAPPPHRPGNTPAGPKELFASKEIQILNLMETPPKPRPLPLKLQLYDLVELKVQGDGNCQFRALSDQLYRSHEHHAVVREQIIRQLKSQPEKYEGYVPMAYNDYLKKMSKNGEWGDHVTLQAAADWYGVKMFVLTSFKDTCYIEILPHNQKSKRIIFLSFWAEVHYNSIYPEGDLPASDTRKKKKWWNLGSLMGT